MSDRLVSPNGRVSLNLQDDGGLVLYHDGSPVWQASDLRINAPPATPTPQWAIKGALRLNGDVQFLDDRGPLLPLGATYGWGLGQCHNDLAACRSQVADLAAAEYQFVRTWFSLGWYPYWRGHEVAPVPFQAQDGVHVPAWTNYFDSVRRYCDVLATHHLHLFWSCGDLQMFDDIGRVEEWAYDCGRTIATTGCRIAFADVNEAWQNWLTNSEPRPEALDQVIEALAAGYGHPFIKLRSANARGEEKADVDAWARDLSQVHGHRGTHAGDFVTAIRHAWNRGYEADYAQRLQIESEPGGSNLDGGSPVMGGLDDPEGLCLLAAANWIAGAAYVSHTHRGVQSWLGPIRWEHGFQAVPKVRAILPPDLHARYRTWHHGGQTASPFTDAAGFPDHAERRIDSACSGPDFVTLVYDTTGATNLLAREAVAFRCYTPDTGEAHAFDLMAGQILPLHYRVGRILVGRRRG